MTSMPDRTSSASGRTQPPRKAESLTSSADGRQLQQQDRLPQQERRQQHTAVREDITTMTSGFHGTKSRRVCINRSVLCRSLRERLYSVIGVQWPFAYDLDRDFFQLLSDKSVTQYSDTCFQNLALSLGPCMSPLGSRSPQSNNVPVIIRRFSKKTSQGKVVLGQLNVRGAEPVLVAKANAVTDAQKTMWIGDDKEYKLRTATGASHRIIAKAYMDGLCSMFFSRLVEKNLSPHFPLCYATSLNRVRFKRTQVSNTCSTDEEVTSPLQSTASVQQQQQLQQASNQHRDHEKSTGPPSSEESQRKRPRHEDCTLIPQSIQEAKHEQSSLNTNVAQQNSKRQKTTSAAPAKNESSLSASRDVDCSDATASPASNGTLCQVIWMEYLPRSMYEVLKTCDRSHFWWSAFFQSAAALLIARRRYGFIHNDCHSENMRVYFVAKETVLYYQAEDGVILAVPTYGNLFVMIDFGRALVKPWADKAALVSSVFGQHGECKSLADYCDNASIDLVRLIGSLEDVVGVIKDKEERHQVRAFCQRVCQTDHGEDYLSLLAQSSGSRLRYFLEAYPRKFCHDALPEKVIPMFYNLYRVDSCPEGITPFPLPLGDPT